MRSRGKFRYWHVCVNSNFIDIKEYYGTTFNPVPYFSTPLHAPVIFPAPPRNFLSVSPRSAKSISKLEESLGMALFIRNSRGVSLTAEGQVLFQHVEAAFEALERGENELKQIRTSTSDELKIGVSNTLSQIYSSSLFKGIYRAVSACPHFD